MNTMGKRVHPSNPSSKPLLYTTCLRVHDLAQPEVLLHSRQAAALDPAAQIFCFRLAYVYDGISCLPSIWTSGTKWSFPSLAIAATYLADAAVSSAVPWSPVAQAAILLKSSDDCPGHGTGLVARLRFEGCSLASPGARGKERRPGGLEHEIGHECGHAVERIGLGCPTTRIDSWTLLGNLRPFSEESVTMVVSVLTAFPS